MAFPWVVVLGPITRPASEFPGVLMQSPSGASRRVDVSPMFVTLRHAAVTRDLGVHVLVRTTCTCRLGDDLFIITHS